MGAVDRQQRSGLPRRRCPARQRGTGRLEHLPEPGQAAGGGDDDDDHRDEDQDILDHRDQRRCAHAAVICVRGDEGEREDQRPTAAGYTHSLEHGPDTHELQRDVGHRGQDAGDGHDEREGPAPVSPAHEVTGGQIAMTVVDRPQPWHHHEEQREDDDRVDQREEPDGAGAERELGDRDVGVGREDAAAQQEPCDRRPEASPGDAPFVETGEVPGSPCRGDEAEHGDEREQRHEDRNRRRAGLVRDDQRRPGVHG